LTDKLAGEKILKKQKIVILVFFCQNRQLRKKSGTCESVLTRFGTLRFTGNSVSVMMTIRVVIQQYRAGCGRIGKTP
jgi:hypothetical protein